jgi:glyoxylase-like metal-dependent hydrolase (beta-lactamase superfamily II)
MRPVGVSDERTKQPLQREESVSSTLIYPLAMEPETGTGAAVEIAPGIMWLRMPLFASLKWINVWIIADEGGWAIVDTGLRSAQTMEAWQTVFATIMGNAPVTRVLATHMHPDHCGMAGWIAERFGARLWMSRLEYLSCRLMAADTGRGAPGEAINFYHAAGWNEQAIERYKEKFGSFGEMIYPMPAAFRRLTDGETFLLGGHQWSVVIGKGHSPEHACLYCAELRLLISGDQVLPRITSNVSVYPIEPEEDPLNDWLVSLNALKDRVPDDVLVLPAHNSPFKGLHARIDQLVSGHHRGLERLIENLAEPRRAVDLFGSLFTRPITSESLGMATGETIAHLNYLWKKGRVIREPDDQGVNWWRCR